jgi:hypothetical protein
VLASPTVINVYRAASVPMGDEREIWSLIAFSRGLIVGFMCAFFTFDWIFLGAATMRGVLRGLEHVAHAVL